MSSNNKDIIDKLDKWIKDQGYPLEISAGMELEKYGLTVHYSDFYEDYETGTKREIDVSAFKWSDFNNPVFLQICCQIECKLSRDRPWVLFITPNTSIETWWTNIICSDIFRIFLFSSQKQLKNNLEINNLPIFKSLPMGHSVVQAFREKKDIAYEAIQSASKASLARAMLIDQKLPEKPEKFICAAVIPAIIIDTRLFTCEVDQRGNITLNECDICLLRWKGPLSVYGSPIIPIITKPAIGKFAKLFGETSDMLISLAEDNITILRDVAEPILERRYTTITTSIG